LFIVAFILIGVSCKKQSADFNSPDAQALEASVSAASPLPCSGNVWQPDDLYYGVFNDRDAESGN
jgi:hypothetical protein